MITYMEDNIYTCIKTLIDVGNTDEAQDMLDDIEDKDARWHYLSGLLYREKNWLNESRKQLEIAVELDPENENYKQELEDIISAAENENSEEKPEMGKRKLRDICCECCYWCCDGCSGIF